jgi:DNA-binding MarR family transcriptional regulator
MDDPVQLSDLLQGLTRRLRRAQAQRLAPLGLTPAQERALRSITRSPEPLRMTELADHLGIVPRSVTTVVDSLEEAGLVRREIDPGNRRAIRLHLTDRGMAVRNDMREARRQAAEDLFAPLPDADRRALAGLLTKLNPGDDHHRHGKSAEHGLKAEAGDRDQDPQARTEQQRLSARPAQHPDVGGQPDGGQRDGDQVHR